MHIDDATPRILWPLATAIPALSSGEIHVWCWSLHAEESVIKDALHILSRDEKSRANRFAFERDRRRYVLAHARVRQLLEKYLDIPATDIIFGRGVSGKPHIAGSIDLQVNLTHSANLAVLAVSKGIEIGVDVELVCGNASLLPINQLSSDEQAELRSLPSESLLNGFYACWTRKESLLKGLGIGLLGQLASFSVMPDSDRPTIHSSSDPALTSMKTWRLADLNPATGYIGALAVRVKPSKTCFFQFIANEAGRHAVD